MLAWKQKLLRLPEKIWFRAMLFCVAAIMAAGSASWLGPRIPFGSDLELASGSVGELLTILASSMLAVIAFSVSIMVSAYNSATGLATPRAIALMLADDRSQNALSTFLGTFLFSIVGIIGLSAGFYDDRGRIVLFFATILVIIVITGTLLNWIQQLSTFGRMGDLIRRVEDASCKALKWHGENPWLGAMPQVDIPADAIPICCDQATGVITTIDVEALQEAAEEHDVVVHLTIYPGKLVYPTRHVMYLAGRDALEIDPQVFRECVLIERDRSFDQDPRFGLTVLSEIASRAMSPAVNDPGTAIAVLNSALRCLECYAKALDESAEPLHTNIHGPEVTVADLFSDLIPKVSRDGAGNFEVQKRIQLILLALSQTNPKVFADASVAASQSALARAETAIHYQPDLDTLYENAKQVQRAADKGKTNA